MSGEFIKDGCGHLEGRECWCGPEILQPCPECDSRPHHDEDTCWRCGGRTLVPAYDDEAPVVIVHADIRLG